VALTAMVAQFAVRAIGSSHVYQIRTTTVMGGENNFFGSFRRTWMENCLALWQNFLLKVTFFLPSLPSFL
jgi:hypothetical protein